MSKLPPPEVVVVVGLELLSLAGSGGEDDEAGSVVAETDMEDVAGVAEDAEVALGEEVDVASCIGSHLAMS